MQVAGVQSVKLDFYKEICIYNNLVNISKNQMKMVVGYLRNQDFQTFLKLVECLCPPSGGSSHAGYQEEPSERDREGPVTRATKKSHQKGTAFCINQRNSLAQL